MRVFGYDTETTGLYKHQGAQLRLAQFWNTQEQVVIDLWSATGPIVLQSYLNHAVLYVFNATFEWQWLEDFDTSTTVVKDVGYMRAFTYGGSKLSLAQIAQEDLLYTMYKELQRSDWSQPVLSAEQLKYALDDARITYHLGCKHFTDGWGERASDASRTVARIQARGVCFDKEAHSRWCKLALKTIESLRLEAQQVSDINWGSTKQVTDFLYEIYPPPPPPSLENWGNYSEPQKVWALETWPKTPTGRLSFSKVLLPKYLESLPKGDTRRDIGEKVLNLNTYVSLYDTFGETLVSKVKDGKLYASFRLFGAITGRFTCSNPNLQQIPKTTTFRAMFVASEGNQLVGADYAQIEWRIVAFLSGDKVLQNAILNGFDLHTFTASKMFKVAYEVVSEDQRRIAKSVGFGLLYGIGDRAMGIALGSSTEAAKAFKRSFAQTYPTVWDWREKTYTDALRKGYVTTVIGRKIPTLRNANGAYNYPVQGSCADLIVEFLRLAVDLPLVLTVHDEFELDTSNSEQDKILLVDLMVQAWHNLFPSDTNPTQVADAKVGKNWGAVH